MRPRLQGRRAGVRSALTAFAALGLAVACTGDNLFTGPALGTGSGEGPSVQISTPANGSSLPVGDSVLVTASAQSDLGMVEIVFGGEYTPAGTQAFAPKIRSLAGTFDTTVAVFLLPVGTTPGDVLIVVQAEDVTGGTGADTVTITLN